MAHLQEFLEYCFRRFKYVIIWSAGQRDYVNKHIQHVFSSLPSPHLVWHFDHCGQSPDSYTKPLAKLTSALPDLDVSKTFIVDDRAGNFTSVNPENGILMHEFSCHTQGCLLNRGLLGEKNCPTIQETKFG